MPACIPLPASQVKQNTETIFQCFSLCFQYPILSMSKQTDLAHETAKLKHSHLNGKVCMQPIVMKYKCRNHFKNNYSTSIGLMPSS